MRWQWKQNIVRIIAKHGGIDLEKSLGRETCEQIPELMKKNSQDLALDQLSEIVANLAKMVEEQRKAIEQMRCLTKQQEIKKNI